MSRHHDHAPHPRALPAALALTLAFAAVEAAAGWWSGSLALLSDAGHMLTDSLALAMATVAARLAHRPPSHRHSFGLARIEVLAALVNAGFMTALILGIAWSAVWRLVEPGDVDINGEVVSYVAAAGLALNLVVGWMLARGGRDLNTRAALLHVVGDALGSIAALASGITIAFTGWKPIDPLLSLAICALIGLSTWRLAREAVHTLLEGVPAEISLSEVGQRLARVGGVVSVHDLHIWSISSTRAALSAHVVVRDFRDWERLLTSMREILHEEFDIDHVTLQPELAKPAMRAYVDPVEIRRGHDHPPLYH